MSAVSDTSRSTLTEYFIENLTHPVEEIRLRAFHNIISKVDRGLIGDDDIVGRRGVVAKLLEWLKHRACPQKKKVLEVIHKFLTNKHGIFLPPQVRPSNLLYVMKKIREEANHELNVWVDKITGIVDAECAASSQTEQLSASQDKDISSASENALPSFSDYINSRLPLNGKFGYVNVEECETSEVTRKGYNFFVWQPLVSADLHVIVALVESLSDINSHDHVLSSCYFFSNVLLQDFPAEIFIQRPDIIKVMLNVLDACDNTSNTSHVDVSQAVLNSLLKLTIELNARVWQCSDPNSSSFMQKLPAEVEFASDTNLEDSSSLQSQQITLPEFCFLVLNRAVIQHDIVLAFELLKLLNLCNISTMWQTTGPGGVEIQEAAKDLLSSIGEILEQMSRYRFSGGQQRLAYLQILAVTKRLLFTAVPFSESVIVIPRKLQTILCISLMDYALYKMYPDLHHGLQLYCQKFIGRAAELWRLFENTLTLCKSMSASIVCIKDHGQVQGQKCLMFFEDALPSLPFHKNLLFIEHFMEMCVHHLHRWPDSEDLAERASRLLIKLLAHTDSDLITATYSCCHKCVMSFLGVHSSTIVNTELAVIFHSEVLIEIISHGVTNQSDKIQRFSSEILIHILKGKIHMSPTAWQQFLNNLIPTLPVLHCHASKDSVLGCTVFRMLDPQVEKSLPIFELLKGNLRMMFSSDNEIRSDAILRLTWLLTQEDESSEKLPDVTSVNCRYASEYFIIDKPVKFTRPKERHTYYQAESLLQIMELLKRSVIEPAVRKSALSQIGIMMEDPQLHLSFLDQGGLDMILDTFRKSFFHSEIMYPSSCAISIIEILLQLCMYNSELRHRLSCCEFIFYCTLRALLLFGSNERLQEHAAQFLCLLLYDNFIVMVPEATSNIGNDTWCPISVPQVIAQHMELPFMSLRHWQSGHHKGSSMEGILKNNTASQCMIRLWWTSKWFGGIDNVLEWTAVKTCIKKEVPENLCITESDLEYLKTSAVNCCLVQCMCNLHCAGSHQCVELSLNQVLGHITLDLLDSGHISYNFQSLWRKLPWKETLVRFLETFPSNSEDVNLLICLLKFLRHSLLAFAGTDAVRSFYWIIQEFKTQRPLINMLKMESDISKDVSEEILLLCEICCLLEQELEGDSKSKVDVPKDPNSSWAHIIQIIVTNLRISNTQQFYDLAYIEKMVSCLSHLTSSVEWNKDCSSILCNLLRTLTDVIQAFHFGEEGTSVASFMGLSIIRSALISIIHVLEDVLSNSRNMEWEMKWLCALGLGNEASSPASDAGWLMSLLLSRDVFLRLSTLELIAIICSVPHGCEIFIRALSSTSPCIWEVALGFLLDHTEASGVREKAALILVHLSNHLLKRDVNLFTDIEVHQSEVQEKYVQKICSLLQECKFFEDIRMIISQLHSDATINPGQYINTISTTINFDRKNLPQCSPELTKLCKENLDGDDTDTSLEGANDLIEQTPIITPSLVRMVCCLIYNFLAWIPVQTVGNIKRTGVFKILCRSISSSHVRSQKKIHTSDVEMYISIYRVLILCVALDHECLIDLVQTKRCIEDIFFLLDQRIFSTKNQNLISVRNRLWSQLFQLLSHLMNNNSCYYTIERLLAGNDPQPFFSAVEKSIDDPASDLCVYASGAVTVLLSQAVALAPSQEEMASSSDIERAVTLQRILDKEIVIQSHTAKLNVPVVLGRNLCSTFIFLYRTHVHGCIGDSKLTKFNIKLIIVKALSNLVYLSREAKGMAIQLGLPDTIISYVKGIYVHLETDGGDPSITIDRKQVGTLLQDLGITLALIINLIHNSSVLKAAVVSLGLHKIIQKLWGWLYCSTNILMSTLKIMYNLTHANTSACRALADNRPSILHEVIKCVLQEMEVLTNNSTYILQLGLGVLKNAGHVSECRNAFFQANLLQVLNDLHPAIMKKKKHGKEIQILWLEFIEKITAFSEGQLELPKVSGAVDTLITLASEQNTMIRLSALKILQHITFNEANRHRLLISNKYLQLIDYTLKEGSDEEKFMSGRMVWALIANSQKAKQTIKSFGISTTVQEALEYFKNINIKSSHELEMNYFLFLNKHLGKKM